jgi:hypothetical protein
MASDKIIMNYQITITRDGSTIHTADISADAVIDLIAVPAKPEVAKKRAPKPEPAGNAKWQKLSDSPRTRLTDEQKIEIERLLIAKVSVPEISPKYKVSDATIYLIKARLKKEGRL